MTNHDQIVRRFAEEAGKPDGKFLNGTDSIKVGHHSGYGSYVINTIYSYGDHFPLAMIMPSADGDPRGWWLLNGDTASISTTRHQALARNAVKGTGLPSMIVSFDALNRAGIKQSGIVPVEILPDRYTTETVYATEAPETWRNNWRQLNGNRWSYERQVHHLGEAVFKASYAYEERVEEAHTDLSTYRRVRSRREQRSGTGYFLSAFDENEPGFGLYFMCQLPDGAEPATVAEAREALKPELVAFAEEQGRTVLRQGDVFAVPSDFTTRNLPGPSQRSVYVLGVNHQVTEVRKLSGLTYGRGMLRHKPRESWRRPEHRTVKLGDGKTWYLLVRNTVPDGRSWSRGGNVD